MVAASGINPITGCDHSVGNECGDHVVDDLFLLETKEAGALTIYVQAQSGIIHILRNQQVIDSANLANLSGEVERRSGGAVQVHAAHLNVNGRGQTQVQDRVDQTARLNVCAEFGQIVPQASAHAVHVLIAADFVAFLQAYLDESGVLSRVAGVN